MKQKWLLTGTALLLAAALAGCGNTPGRSGGKDQHGTGADGGAGRRQHRRGGRGHFFRDAQRGGWRDLLQG